VRASVPHSSPYLSRLWRFMKLENDPEDLERLGLEPEGALGGDTIVTLADSDFVCRRCSGEDDVIGSIA
jgi:hypothetical protein